MKRRLISCFAFVTLFFILILSFSPVWIGNVYAQRYYYVRIYAILLPENIDLNVGIEIDGSPTGYDTPHFFRLNATTHTITVPSVDSNGNPFAAWSTGETTPTITVTPAYPGYFTVYYGVAPLPSTYNVTIETAFTGPGELKVDITKDGLPTGFKTPYTFTGLIGIHNFTVPSMDTNGHSFAYWIDKWESQIMLNTITVWSGGTYSAFYERAFLCQLITPSDPAIVAVAGNMSWVEVLDYVSSQISYGNETSWHLPTETLDRSSGQCRDYATLCVSMLRARGYIAYAAFGTIHSSDVPESHVWVILDLNGTLVHLEPQSSWQDQRFVNFTKYNAEYYFDEIGIYSPRVSENPHPLVTFIKSDLESGVKWWVNFNGSNQSSTWELINFYAANGTYDYSIGASDYVVSPSIGKVTVNGTDVEIKVKFTMLPLYILDQILPIIIIIVPVFIILMIVYRKKISTKKLSHDKN